MKIDLHDIVTPDFQNEMQNSFARLSQFGVVFVDRDGNHIGEGGNFTPFCKRINEHPQGAHCCACTNRQAIDMALSSPQPDRPAIFVCHAGLVNIEVPILFEGECLGAFTAGQVICEEDRYPKDTNEETFNWQEDPKLCAYRKDIPVLTPEQIENTADMMYDLASYMLKNHAYLQLQKEMMAQKEMLLAIQKQQAELESQLVRARFDALQHQIMPHFIFNVLNSISRLISMTEYDDAQKMLTAYTKMMRYCLSDTEHAVRLEQELEFVRNYLLIQKIRFGDRLQYFIDCNPEMLQLELPFFSLQPFVENALEHGILDKSNGGTVHIRCLADKDAYRIIIEDDGLGIDEETLVQIFTSFTSDSPSDPGSHVGINNCYRRLKYTYGDRFYLSITNEEGTLVELHIDR